MEPLTSGKYPESMRFLVGERLPKFSKQEAKLLRDSFDFIGINYYTSVYVADKPQVEPSIDQPASELSYITDANVNYSSQKTSIYLSIM